MYARMLNTMAAQNPGVINLREGGPEEVEIIVRRIPVYWKPIIHSETILSMRALLTRVRQHRCELSQPSQGSGSHKISASMLLPLLCLLGVTIDPAKARGATPYSSVHVSKTEGNSFGAMIEEVVNKTTNENDNEEIKAAFQVISQKKFPKAPRKYAFSCNNHVKTKMRKKPPSPC